MASKTPIQKLAFRIAEEVMSDFGQDPHEYPDHPDLEEVYRTIYNLLPDDEVFRQAIEEHEELSRDELSDGPPRCGSILNKLREVLHAQEGYPLGKLLELATERCEQYNELVAKQTWTE